MEDPTQNPTSPEEDEQLLPKPEPEGAAPEPPEGAGKEEGKKAPEPPQPRTYSEEEWKTRQSSWDKQMADREKQHKEEVKQVQEQLVKRQRQEFISQAVERGESEEQAGTLFDLQKQLQQKEDELTEVAKILDTAKKERTADELVAKFSLSKDSRDSLLKAESPADMKTLALEMALEGSKAEKTPPTKTPSGVGSGKGVDTSKLSPRERAMRYFEEKLGED